PEMRAGPAARARSGRDYARAVGRARSPRALGRDPAQSQMKKPQTSDATNRICAVTLDEESIGRSGPDIEHERAVAIYDLVESNVFAPSGDHKGPFALQIGITGNRLVFDIRKEDGTPVVA